MEVSRSFLKNIGNGIYLKQEEEKVLEKYHIDYKNCKDIKELMFMIEDYLNSSCEEFPDLENLSNRLSEFNYYYNTNK